ncbi:GNAT family N-acetyltransferase [Psychrobium sp. 1_MG-2023]|uniref:GNAT family N-acetyltransferase n=1 Tax=Psychrobium sp. 1_MG-2023 TaxID=3062624 RepID=UPI000C32917A|nr:GNAT family N-acetyltransferase [Psychrobium sp. 1_MG-2023]MDP2562419.1 GNAT family N-acetyltransferase [Psychrobium sp. 1_MG-2023]PKF56147.1 hypothetical protein CW748_10850 [Alteromonadales bacterium alter-6D02]
MQPLVIRQAQRADCAEISYLITRNAKLLLNEDFDGDGLNFFLNTVTERAIREYMDQGFNYLVAQANNEIIGVIAIKDNSHMFHLFVDKNYHKKGIAKQLWESIYTQSVESGNNGTFTLNSTSYALPVYQRWGFTCTDELQIRHGIRYTPMSLTVD